MATTAPYTPNPLTDEERKAFDEAAREFQFQADMRRQVGRDAFLGGKSWADCPIVPEFSALGGVSGAARDPLWEAGFMDAMAERVRAG